MKAKVGRKTTACLPVALVKAMCATTRCTSSGCVGPVTRISLFMQDWELAKVALSCHMALDMLCQEILVDAWLPDEFCVEEGSRQ